MSSQLRNRRIEGIEQKDKKTLINYVTKDLINRNDEEMIKTVTGIIQKNKYDSNGTTIETKFPGLYDQLKVFEDEEGPIFTDIFPLIPLTGIRSELQQQEEEDEPEEEEQPQNETKEREEKKQPSKDIIITRLDNSNGQGVGAGGKYTLYQNVLNRKISSNSFTSGKSKQQQQRSTLDKYNDFLHKTTELQEKDINKILSYSKLKYGMNQILLLNILKQSKRSQKDKKNIRGLLKGLDQISGLSFM